MTRKTLKPSEETKDRLDSLKRGGETVDGILNRAFDALEADESDQNGTVPRCTDCQCQAEVWTVEDGQLVCGVCADSDVELSS